MKNPVKDLSSVLDDSEHPCFVCALCDNPMEETDHVEICEAWRQHVLVHSACAYDAVREDLSA